MTGPAAAAPAPEAEAANEQQSAPAEARRTRARPHPVVGQRNRNGVGGSGHYPKEKLFMQSVRPQRPGITFSSEPPRKPGPLQATINAYNYIDKIEKKGKDKLKVAGQKARLRTRPEHAEVVPPEPGADIYVSGSMDLRPGRKGIPRAMWDSKLGKFGRRAGTTASQTLGSGLYTMFGFALEIIMKYLKEGWWDFAIKTLFVKEFLGGLARLPMRIIRGPDRETVAEKAAKKELESRREANVWFVNSATRAREVNTRTLTEEESRPYKETNDRLEAKNRLIVEAEPDVPRHATVPTTADVEARKLSHAGSGLTSNVVVLDRNDDDNKQRRGRSRGRSGGGRGF